MKIQKLKHRILKKYHNEFFYKKKHIEKHECCICKENMKYVNVLYYTNTDEIPKKISCNHEFHTGCINAWFLGSDTCPICRQIDDDPIIKARNQISVPDIIPELVITIFDTCFRPDFNTFDV